MTKKEMMTAVVMEMITTTIMEGLLRREVIQTMRKISQNKRKEARREAKVELAQQLEPPEQQANKNASSNECV
jgi:predicted FMN-binding regulatory protein PaiB